MNTQSLFQTLLNTNQFHLHEMVFEYDQIRLDVESTIQQAPCPICSKVSHQLHSTYRRYPMDLAWANWPVVIQLRVKRFFCRNRQCPKRTFAERFSDFVSPYARKTQRVIEKQQRVSLCVGARTAENLLAINRMGISDTTVIRLIRAFPDQQFPPVRVLGVDDWAKKKGQTYGTILVDLERGQIVDLLEDRVAESLAKWLRAHPEIEIVSRDRSQTYAEAIRQGAPQVVQIADRWHLLKNLSDIVFKILQQEYPSFRRQLEPDPVQASVNTPEIQLSDESEPLTQSEERRKERMERSFQLRDQGWSQKEIAHRLHLHPKTIRRYWNGSSPKTRRHLRGSRLDPYKSYLVKRWKEGCHNAAQLCREIKQKGFRGESTMVRLFIKSFRQSDLSGQEVQSQRPPSLRTLTWWITKKPEDWKEDDEKILSQISVGQLKIAKTLVLARAFAAMVRQQRPEQLKAWLEEAEQSGYPVWKNFAAGIREDRDAVQAALTYSWSNGPTEGHINRLKCLKRQMYGRARDDLLRKRVLWQPFT